MSEDVNKMVEQKAKSLFPVWQSVQCITQHARSDLLALLLDLSYRDACITRPQQSGLGGQQSIVGCMKVKGHVCCPPPLYPEVGPLLVQFQGFV